MNAFEEVLFEFFDLNRSESQKGGGPFALRAFLVYWISHSPLGAAREEVLALPKVMG